MKKKKWLNSKIFFTISLVFLVCCFMATSLWAARRIAFTSANAKDFIQKLNQNENASMGQILGLSGDEAFKLLRKNTDFNRVTHFRYQQTYKGVPVWGMQTIISRCPSQQVFRLNGTMVLDIPGDIKSIPASFDPPGALRRMQDLHKERDAGAAWFFKNERYGTYIYVDKDNRAYLCYVVSFFADTECGNPSQFIHFIEVKTGKVLHSFDMLKYAEGTGPGGNLKTGYYEYGIDYPGFGVTETGGVCTMDTPDVLTIDLEHKTQGTTPYSYTCYRNTHEEINGGYCPLNDAQYFGQVVYDMYRNWYGVPPIPFQLKLRCHYSVNYEGIFWGDGYLSFGDGHIIYYPLVALDLIAHEVSHGFTEYNSGLIYSSQSGGINESFSDMAGEGAKYYMRGSNDFMVCYDIYKDPNGALRYMYDPPLDGLSIDHVDDYYEGMDVHYSSGIFNKAFYIIATTPGWTTGMAFDIFVKANQDYWIPSTTFQQGAEGAISAAVDYGYPCPDIVNAFVQVGINLVCPGPPIADFTASPTSGGEPLTVHFTDQSTAATSYSWDFGDGGGSTEQNPVYTYTSRGIYTVILTVSNAYGSDTEIKIDYILVLPPQIPAADFTASATDISIGNSVTFTDQSTENPTSWDWTFEGGTPGSSTVQNPVITYNTLGVFTVTLTATNIMGSDTETKVDYITVHGPLYCSSSGSSQSYEYIAGVEVGDLNNPSGASPYSDFTGLVAHLTWGGTVNVSLTPEFTGSEYTEYWKIWIDYNSDNDFEDASEEVFAGSGSSIVSGSFTVPTATIIGDTRMRVSMSYGTWPPMCGTFTYGEVEDYTANIVSDGNLPPTTDFTYTIDGMTVTFTDNSYDPDGVIVSWLWDFGVGTTSTEQNPIHTYAAPGTYTVTLTVTDDDGASSTVSKIITITAGVEIYVYDITQTINKAGKNYWSTAVVTIWDTNNNPVPDATVYISWSGVVSGTDSGITGPDGTVTFVSDKVKSTGPFIITVIDVIHPTLPYKPEYNIETSDSASY